MSLNRWNARRDATEAAIVDALRQAGADVLRLDPFDLLVLHRGRLLMLDCKVKGGRRTLAQQQLVARGWPLVFVENVEDVWRVLNLRREIPC
jgi:hypothetical protein